MDDAAHRISDVLSPEPTLERLFSLARTLKDEGYSQEQLKALFSSAQEATARDEDETAYDAILDTLDYIVGYCEPSKALFP